MLGSECVCLCVYMCDLVVILGNLGVIRMDVDNVGFFVFVFCFLGLFLFGLVLKGEGNFWYFN